MADALADVVRYCIYPDEERDLEAFRDLCLQVVDPYLRGYIWQHEPFNLHAAVAVAAKAFVPHIYGSSRFGDNVEDEWFVVFLLWEVSRKIPEACIRVWDTDGDFLLIEGAYALPKWLKPANSSNRVFIRQALLHILPQAVSSCEAPTLSQALQVMVSGSISTRASDAVQELIQRRIAGYPQQAVKNLHTARCILPLPVAHLLRQEPQLVSLAVEAFYDRDIDSMKVASGMKKFVPDAEQVQMVDVLVRMSKVMYAQLVHQVFQAPPRYPMPLLSSSRSFKAAELGMKITCGCEMLFWEASLAAGEEVEADPGWQAFRASLEKNGYFKGLLEGSQEHKRLVQAALEHYRDTDTAARTRSALHSAYKRVEEILSLPHGMADFPAPGRDEGDDDAWLCSGEEDLGRILAERQREVEAYEATKSSKKDVRKSVAEGMEEGEEDRDPMDVAKSMQAFVERVSSFEGAEVVHGQTADEAVSMDMGRFLDELQSALNLRGQTASLEASSSDEDDDDVEYSDGEEEADDGGFLQEYDEALDSELGQTTLHKSFVRAEQLLSTADHSSKAAAEREGSSPSMQQLGGVVSGEVQAVDVNVNLVESLLQSVRFEEGMPGPASNLLGMMGVRLPRKQERQ